MDQTAAISGWVSDAATRRRPEVLALLVLLGGAVASLVVAVLVPMSPQAPITLGYVMIGVALAMVAGTLVAGDRLPRAALLGQVVVATLCNSVLVAEAHTTAGAMGDGLAYVWLTVYVAIFFPHLAAAFALFCSAAYGVGLAVSDVPPMFTGWAVLSLSTLVLAIVLGAVSRTFLRRLHTDALTGVLNREGLALAADRLFGRARRRSDEIAVAVLDFDRFKEVNDRDGHAVGDRLLRDAAHAWRGALRDDDVLARLGGDEFVLLLPRTTPTQVEPVLARLAEAHPVAWSVGVTQWRAGESLADCLERADRRLYEHKTR